MRFLRLVISVFKLANQVAASSSPSSFLHLKLCCSNAGGVEGDADGEAEGDLLGETEADGDRLGLALGLTLGDSDALTGIMSPYKLSFCISLISSTEGGIPS